MLKQNPISLNKFKLRTLIFLFKTPLSVKLISERLKKPTKVQANFFLPPEEANIDKNVHST